MSKIQIVFLSIAGTLLVLFTAAFLAVVFLRKRHPGPVGENMTAIAKGWIAIQGGLQGMGSGAHYIFCYLLIYFWWFSMWLRTLVPPVMTVLFLLAGGFTALELALKIATKLQTLAPLFFAGAVAVISGLIQGATEVTDEAKSHGYILLFLLSIEILIALHHLKEHKHRDREQKMLVRLLKLQGPLNEVCIKLHIAVRTIVDPADREREKRSLIGGFLREFDKTFREIFEERGLNDVNICVMEEATADRLLKSIFDSSDGKDVHDDFSLPQGKGAAGAAVAMSQTVYIPDVGYEHAVIVTDSINEVLPRVYVRGDDNFASIMCSPLVVLGHPDGQFLASNSAAPEEPRGRVVNFSSRRRSAFSQADFVVARLAASILVLMFTQSGVER